MSVKSSFVAIGHKKIRPEYKLRLPQNPRYILSMRSTQSTPTEIQSGGECELKKKTSEDQGKYITFYFPDFLYIV